MVRDGLQWMEWVKEDPVLEQVIHQDPFVAKPRTLQCFSFFPRPRFNHSREAILTGKPLHSKGKAASCGSRLSPEQWEFFVDCGPGNHLLQRWNERVGPVLEGEELDKLLYHLFQQGRMEVNPKGWGWIDQEVVFGWKAEEKRFIIQTFLGRISLKPALRYYNELLHFHRKQSDFLNLDVSSETIRRQFPPALPESVAYFTGNLTDYRLESYRYQKEDGQTGVLYHLWQKGPKGVETLWIDPERAGEQRLNKKVLHLLLCYGHRDFLLRYLILHRPEKLMNKYWKRKEWERERREGQKTS